MALKTGIVSLALSAVLFGFTAQAQGTHAATPVGADDPGFRGPQGPHGHPPQPRPPPNQEGRYELQQVKKWMPARYDKVWVPEVCTQRARRREPQCEPGHYVQKMIPAHYETVEEWVWVAAPHRRY